MTTLSRTTVLIFVAASIAGCAQLPHEQLAKYKVQYQSARDVSTKLAKDFDSFGIRKDAGLGGAADEPKKYRANHLGFSRYVPAGASGEMTYGDAYASVWGIFDAYLKLLEALSAAKPTDDLSSSIDSFANAVIDQSGAIAATSLGPVVKPFISIVKGLKDEILRLAAAERLARLVEEVDPLMRSLVDTLVEDTKTYDSIKLVNLQLEADKHYDVAKNARVVTRKLLVELQMVIPGTAEEARTDASAAAAKAKTSGQTADIETAHAKEAAAVNAEKKQKRSSDVIALTKAIINTFESLPSWTRRRDTVQELNFFLPIYISGGDTYLAHYQDQSEKPVPAPPAVLAERRPVTDADLDSLASIAIDLEAYSTTMKSLTEEALAYRALLTKYSAALRGMQNQHTAMVVFANKRAVPDLTFFVKAAAELNGAWADYDKFRSKINGSVGQNQD